MKSFKEIAFKEKDSKEKPREPENVESKVKITYILKHLK